jgi:hypothetical protein
MSGPAWKKLAWTGSCPEEDISGHLLLWELAWRRSLLVIYLFTDLFELNFMFHSLQHLTVVSISFCKELLVNKDTAWLSANSRLRREVQRIDGS